MDIRSDAYIDICETIPILCVDIALRHRGQWVLVKRSEWPREQEWWLPGGRMLWGESISDAADRILSREISLCHISDYQLLGFYEDTFYAPTSRPCRKHTVSLVLRADAADLVGIELDQTSVAWKLNSDLPAELKLSDLKQWQAT